MMTVTHARFPGLTSTITAPLDASEALPVVARVDTPCGAIRMTVLVDGFYFDIVGTLSFKHVSPVSLLRIPSEPCFQMLQREQAQIGEHAPTMELRARHFVLGELLALKGGSLSAEHAWWAYAEHEHLEGAEETSQELFKHRYNFAAAWHHVAGMLGIK